MPDLPKRKSIRIEGFDYATVGAYFITICTANRAKMFWTAVGADIIRPQNIPLSPIGQLVEESILQVSAHYKNVSVEKYCIMPNHIHMIVTIHTDVDGRIISAPTIPTIVGSLKRWVSRQIGRPIWQKSFYEHTIRNEQDYNEIWEYIENNALKYALRR